LPYRDSKLTRLLQGALSGNSLVSILCTIQIGAAGTAATANTHTTEIINTLKFASRAKNSIVSHAKRAEEALGVGGDGGARVLLERYRMEILELRKQLDTQHTQKHSDEDTKDDEEERAREKEAEKEAEARHEEQLLEMQRARTALKERIDHLNKLILSSKSIGVNSGGSFSSMGMNARFSQVSLQASIRSSTSVGSRSFMERRTSMGSSSSTIGRRSSSRPRSSGEDGPSAEDEDDSVGEYADGTASLQAQNQALQSDLADKNRYIATLEKRLLQARRASSSRASPGFPAPSKAIMVGEDHSVAATLKEKDAEITELKARLEDKDRMLTALRHAARSRDAAEGIEHPKVERPKVEHPKVENRVESRSSLLYEFAASPPPQASLPDPPAPDRKSSSPVRERKVSSPVARKRTRSVDEMSRILDEMIQEKVEQGQAVRGSRGSVRVVSGIVSDGLKPSTLAEPTGADLEPLREDSTMKAEPNQVALEA
jgi:centromeric protein E